MSFRRIFSLLFKMYSESMCCQLYFCLQCQRWLKRRFIKICSAPVLEMFFKCEVNGAVGGGKWKINHLTQASWEVCVPGLRGERVVLL